MFYRLPCSNPILVYDRKIPDVRKLFEIRHFEINFRHLTTQQLFHSGILFCSYPQKLCFTNRSDSSIRRTDYQIVDAIHEGITIIGHIKTSCSLKASQVQQKGFQQVSKVSNQAMC